jgi:hypothetical protein
MNILEKKATMKAIVNGINEVGTFARGTHVHLPLQM